MVAHLRMVSRLLSTPFNPEYVSMETIIGLDIKGMLIYRTVGISFVKIYLLQGGNAESIHLNTDEMAGLKICTTI